VGERGRREYLSGEKKRGGGGNAPHNSFLKRGISSCLFCEKKERRRPLGKREMGGRESSFSKIKGGGIYLLLTEKKGGEREAPEQKKEGRFPFYEGREKR